MGVALFVYFCADRGVVVLGNSGRLRETETSDKSDSEAPHSTDLEAPIRISEGVPRVPKTSGVWCAEDIQKTSKLVREKYNRTRHRNKLN